MSGHILLNLLNEFRKSLPSCINVILSLFFMSATALEIHKKPLFLKICVYSNRVKHV